MIIISAETDTDATIKTTLYATFELKGEGTLDLNLLNRAGNIV